MKKMKKFGLWIGAVLALAPVVALAAPSETLETEGQYTTVAQLWTQVQKGLNWFLTIVIAIGAVMIIYGGFLYMQGDAEGGRKQLTYGIIGVLIAAGAWTIIIIVRNFFGVSG